MANDFIKQKAPAMAFDPVIYTATNPVRPKSGSLLKQETQSKTPDSGFNAEVYTATNPVRPKSGSLSKQKTQNKTVPETTLSGTDSYSAIPLEKDYPVLSAPSAPKRESDDLNLFKPKQRRGDDVYDFINDLTLPGEKSGYRSTVEAIAHMSGQSTKYGEYTPYSMMAQDEIGVYNYLYAKKGKNAAEEYLTVLRPDLEKRQYDERAEKLGEVSKKHPVIMSAASVPATIMGGAAGAADLLAQNVRRAVTGKPVSYYSPAQRAATLPGEIRGAVAEEIEDNTNFEIADRNVASFLYSNLMSMADSAAAMLMLPAGGARAAMSVLPVSQKARETAQRGGSDTEALISGLAAAVFEALFESVSIGNFKALQEVPVTGIKTVFSNIAKSVGVNASEEMATELSNIIFDAVALGDVSNWRYSIERYMMQGLSESEAKSQVVKELFGQVAEAGIGGGLMGAGFGGIGTALSVYSGGRANSGTAAAAEPGTQNAAVPQAALPQTAAEPVQNAAAPFQAAAETVTQNAAAPQETLQRTAAAADIDSIARSADEAFSDELSRQLAEQGLTAPESSAVRSDADAAQGSKNAALTQEVSPQALTAAEDIDKITKSADMAFSDELVRQLTERGLVTPENNYIMGGFENVGAERTAGADGSAVTERGGDVSLRSGQRYDGISAGGQAGVLAAGAGGGAPGNLQAGRAVKIKNRVGNLRSRPVSSASLGIVNGTEAPSVMVIPYEAWDEGMSDAAGRIFRQTGKTPVYVAGGIQVTGKDGTTKTARGAVIGDKIILRADDMRFGAEQIADHEIFHSLAAQTPGLIGDIKDAINRRFTKAEIEKIADRYLEAYNGLYSADADGSLDFILEEIYADAYAGMDAFGAEVLKYTGIVRGEVFGKPAAPELGTAPIRGPPDEGIQTEYEKDRTDARLMSLGVQFPSDQPMLGSMGTIAHSSGDVNTPKLGEIRNVPAVPTGDNRHVGSPASNGDAFLTNGSADYRTMPDMPDSPPKTEPFHNGSIPQESGNGNIPDMPRWISLPTLEDADGGEPRFSVDELRDGEYDDLVRRGDVLLGDTGVTYTEGNNEISFVYAVVPRESLIISNDEHGGVNELYPQELQPRDRSRAASQMQIQKISRNLNPALLAESMTAQNGAPIVRGDGVVIGGNARTQAVAAAYDAGRADGYENFMREHSARYGIESIMLPENPVLVRVALGIDDWAALARELNHGTTAAYSATEQAMTDAAKMDDILDLLVPNDEGTINNEANRLFIAQFVDNVVPSSEWGAMTTATGMLSQAGLERAEYAIFARAYNDPGLLARLSENLDNDTKNLTNALLDTSAAAAAINAGVENGTLYDLKAVDSVLRAAKIYTNAKRRGRTVDEHLSQMSLTDDYTELDTFLARFIEQNKRSAKQIRTMINCLYEQVEEYGDPRQESIFGDNSHTIQDTMEGAVRRYERETGREIDRRGFTMDGELGEGGREDTGAGTDTGGGGYGSGGAELSGEAAERTHSGGEPGELDAVSESDPAFTEDSGRFDNPADTGEFIDNLIESVPEPPAAVDVSANELRRSADEYMNILMTPKEVIKEPKTDVKGKVSDKVPKERKTAGAAVSDAWSFFKRKMVDSGDAVRRIGKAFGDKHLYEYYNMARASSNAAISMITESQTDIAGRRIGKGLNEIFRPIRKQGKEYYNNFQLYMFHEHNVDRMSRYSKDRISQARKEFSDFVIQNPWIKEFTDFQLEHFANDIPSTRQAEAEKYVQLKQAILKAEMVRNKPVFGNEITADYSRYAADKLLRENPEFKELADGVYAYIDGLMKYRVDSGLITEEDEKSFKKIYPHYVPTFREFDSQKQGRGRTDGVIIGKTIGRAEGSEAALVPLHKALAQQTFSVVREGSKNRFGQRVLKNAEDKKDIVSKHIYEMKKYKGNSNANTFDDDIDTPLQQTNTFVVRDNGKMWEMSVSPALYEAVKALSPDLTETNVFTRVVRAGNTLFKQLVTGYNPLFLAKNFMRDFQDAGLYSKNLPAFLKAYPTAVKEIASNGEYWQQYKALGGMYSSVFDYNTGEVREPGKLGRVLHRIEALNMAVEQAPRLAEFIATVKKGGDSMDNLMEAMYNAADVTVNFGRSGTWGKFLNANFVPFLNPGIQGFDKMLRMATETRGAKRWVCLAMKAAVLGVAPILLNELLYGDDEEWEDIRERDKDIYYLFKIGDGLWLKLPKGRTLSMLGMPAERLRAAIAGEDIDWGGFITTAAAQIAPANPLQDNILKAWMDADLFDEKSSGKTWYGTPIENQRLENYTPGERYDEKTDEISKWIGGLTGLSPKKINYLLDSYTGVVGDVLLPLMTPRAERGFFKNAFTLDTVSSNRISEDFYSLADELSYARNAPKATAADEILYRYWNKQLTAVSEINRAIRGIESDRKLKDAEKKELVRAQQQIRNEIMKNALEDFEIYRREALDYYGKEGTEAGKKDPALWRVTINAANGEYEQLEVLQELMSEADYNRLCIGYEYGITPQIFVTYREILTKVNDGGGVSQEEAMNAITRMRGLTDKQRAVLWQLQNKSWSEKKNPYDKKMGKIIRAALE